MRAVIFFIALVLLFSNCRKTEDIGKVMQPAVDNAKAFQGVTAHAFLPISEVLRDWSSSRASVPFALHTDSGVWFDYRTGILCADGLTRKGKCLIKNGFSMNAFEDTCWFSASSSDSFAVLSSGGPVYFSGKLKFIGYSAYSILVSGKADISTLGKNSFVSIDGLIEFDPEGQTTRSAKLKTRWNADVSIIKGEMYHYDVMRSVDCFPCFSTGTGHNPSYSVTVNFNPFGNAACDPVAAFIKGREEWLEDLW